MKRRKRGHSREVTDRGGWEGRPSTEGGPVRHVPVMLPAMLKALAPLPGQRFIDATFGAGGYTRAILDAAHCGVLALDRDPSVIAEGKGLLSQYPGRLFLAETPFSHLETAAHQIGWQSVDGVVFDLGVSSMQLDEAERGFSFMQDGPLDMRMSGHGMSAADVVNSFEKDELANLIYEFGEERRSRAIASAIVEARMNAPFERTAQLAGLVASVLGRRPGDAKHPATRTFQALRIFVNDELRELEKALHSAERMLVPGGRLVVVSFHSLEDRIVKQFLSQRSKRRAAVSRHLPMDKESAPPTFEVVNRHGTEPDAEEIVKNPRARSARLRWGIRTNAPHLQAEKHDV